eukprot:6184953-Pleurochrysis_carterae.AAC.4
MFAVASSTASSSLWPMAMAYAPQAQRNYVARVPCCPLLFRNTSSANDEASTPMGECLSGDT